MTININEFTYHARVERAGRINLIVNTIGWGQIIVTAPDMYGKPNVETVLTDTGVMAIRDKETCTIISVWIASPKQLKAVYRRRGEEKVPKQLWRRANYYFNTEEYQKESKNTKAR